MIYISRLLPDIKNTQARRELANPYEMHRTLARAFPEGNEWADARLLFRVEQNGRIDDVAVLAQSRYLPDWSFLNNMNYLRKEVEIKRVEHINAPVGGRFCFGQCFPGVRQHFFEYGFIGSIRLLDGVFHVGH